jgi:hypothetical protein
MNKSESAGEPWTTFLAERTVCKVPDMGKNLEAQEI